MSWVLHDTFMTKKDAQVYGESIVEVGLAKGIKVVKSRNKIRPYELYVLPLSVKGKSDE